MEHIYVTWSRHFKTFIETNKNHLHHSLQEVSEVQKMTKKGKRKKKSKKETFKDKSNPNSNTNRYHFQLLSYLKWIN